MAREIEDVVAEMFPHEGKREWSARDDGGVRVYCVEGRCVCGATRKRARMLAAVQMHVDKVTGGRVYLDRG